LERISGRNYITFLAKDSSDGLSLVTATQISFSPPSLWISD